MVGSKVVSCVELLIGKSNNAVPFWTYIRLNLKLDFISIFEIARQFSRLVAKAGILLQKCSVSISLAPSHKSRVAKVLNLQKLFSWSPHSQQFQCWLLVRLSKNSRQPLNMCYDYYVLWEVNALSAAWLSKTFPICSISITKLQARISHYFQIRDSLMASVVTLLSAASMSRKAAKENCFWWMAFSASFEIAKILHWKYKGSQTLIFV